MEELVLFLLAALLFGPFSFKTLQFPEAQAFKLEHLLYLPTAVAFQVPDFCPHPLTLRVFASLCFSALPSVPEFPVISYPCGRSCE